MNMAIDLCVCGHRHIESNCSSCLCNNFVPHPQPDPVNHPKHYTSKSIEVIEIIEAWDMNFRLGNVIKYVLRHADKNGLEDLKKARWYLDREIEKRSK